MDILVDYLKPKNKDTRLLIQCATCLANGAVFKRLGFLLERFAPEQEDAIKACETKLSKGNAKLEPALPCDRLITKWRLWVPESWAEEEIK